MLVGHLATVITIASALNLLISFAILCIHYLRLFSNVLKNVAMYRSVIPVVASFAYCMVAVNFAEGHEEHQTSSVEWTWRGELLVVVLSIQSALFMMLETHKIISEQRKSRREQALPIQSTAHLLEQVVLHLATVFVLLAVLESTKVSLFNNFLLAGYCVFGAVVCLMVAISAKYIWDNTKKARLVFDKLKQTSSICWICMACLVPLYLVLLCTEVVGASLSENDIDANTEWTKSRLFLGILLIVCPNVVATQRISILMEEMRKRAYLEGDTSNAHDSNSSSSASAPLHVDLSKSRKQRNSSPHALLSSTTMRERTPVLNETEDTAPQSLTTTSTDAPATNQQQPAGLPLAQPILEEQPILLETHTNQHTALTPFFRPHHLNLYTQVAPVQQPQPQAKSPVTIVQPQVPHPPEDDSFLGLDPDPVSAPLFNTDSLPLQQPTFYSTESSVSAHENTRQLTAQLPLHTDFSHPTQSIDNLDHFIHTRTEETQPQLEIDSYLNDEYLKNNPQLNDEDTYTPNV